MFGVDIGLGGGTRFWCGYGAWVWVGAAVDLGPVV